MDDASTEQEPLLREPTVTDATPITRLVKRCGALDVNSHYAYLLLCHHFAESCVVGELGGEVVGFTSAMRLPRDVHTLFVWQIAVDERARGRGLAGKMLDELRKRPALADVRWFELTITTSNEASRRLFNSFARRQGVELEESPLFPRDLFDPDEDHEPEDLFRIGPFPVPD